MAAYKKANWPNGSSNRKQDLPKLRGGSTTISPDQFKCGQIFDAISDQINDPENVDLIKKVNASYKFKVTGKQGQAIWIVNAKSETKPYVDFNKDEKADCILMAKDEDLFDVMTGKTDSMKAFLSGKLKLSGNPTLAMKLKQFQGKVKEALEKEKLEKKIETVSDKPEKSSEKQAKKEEKSEMSSVQFSSDKIFADIQSKLEIDSNLAKKVNAVYKFVITDAKSNLKKFWFVDCKSMVPTVKFDANFDMNLKADCTIETTDDTFVKIISGKLNPQKAFFSKQLKVSGNVMLASKLTQFQEKAQSKL